MTATRRGPFIEATSTVATSRVEEFDGSFRPRGAPEDDIEVETGWDSTGAFGTWRKWRGGASWTRRDAPTERAEDEVEPWLRSACRAIGCVLLGAPIGAWRAASWVIDVPGIRSEHRLHREVHRATDRCEQGIGTVEALHVAIRHHDGYQRMHLRRAWWRRAKAVALVVGGAFGWWWLARHVGALGRCALLGALVLGAVCGAHRIGAMWLARRAAGDEWRDATGVPPPVDMPSPHRDQPRQAEPPTDTVVLMGVRGAFVPGDTVLPTAEIVNRCRNGGGWWAQVTTREMGMRLAAIGLKSVNTNMAGEHGVNPKGFRLAAIISALAARTSQPDHDE